MKEAIQISKNLIKGEVIRSTDTLLEMAHNKQSVYHHNWGVKPAAVIINMNFVIVHRLISDNNLFTTIKFIKLKTK